MPTIQEHMSGKNINFLIGSGASMPLFSTLSIGKNMPTFEELISSPFIEDENRKKLYLYYFDNWISKMDSSSEENENYKCVFDSYYKFISMLIEIMEREPLNKPRRINIFTTNYDMMFEKAFDKVNSENKLAYFNDGSSGFMNKIISIDNFNLNVSHSGSCDKCRVELPTINLFKMHGSISWNKSTINAEDKIEADYELKNVTKLKNIIEENRDLQITEQIATILYEIDEKQISMEEKCIEVNSRLGAIIDNDECKEKLDEFYKEYKNLLIINPDKNKFYHTVYEQHYYQMIRNFSYEIEKENTILFAFGFSFNDEHILDIFRRSIINPKSKIYIVPFNENAFNSISEKLKGYKNIEYVPTIEQLQNGVNGNYHFFNKFLGDNENGE